MSVRADLFRSAPFTKVLSPLVIAAALTAVDCDRPRQASGPEAGDGGNGGNGGSGGGGEDGGGGGEGVPCVTAADCPGVDGACQRRTCEGGRCGLDAAPRGKPVGEQVLGDCKARVCDGHGAVIELDDDQDAFSDGDPCSADVSRRRGAEEPSGAGDHGVWRIRRYRSALLRWERRLCRVSRRRRLPEQHLRREPLCRARLRRWRDERRRDRRRLRRLGLRAVRGSRGLPHRRGLPERDLRGRQVPRVVMHRRRDERGGDRRRLRRTGVLALRHRQGVRRGRRLPGRPLFRDDVPPVVHRRRPERRGDRYRLRRPRVRRVRRRNALRRRARLPEPRAARQAPAPRRSASDGVVNAAAEACDDGNTSNTDACITTCVAASCGDGFVRRRRRGVVTTETRTTPTPAPRAARARRGTGSSAPASRRCDDGNRNAGDGCVQGASSTAAAAARSRPARSATTKREQHRRLPHHLSRREVRATASCGTASRAATTPTRRAVTAAARARVVEARYTCRGTPSVCTFSKERNCGDAEDDDLDGETDCADPDCALRLPQCRRRVLARAGAVGAVVHGHTQDRHDRAVAASVLRSSRAARSGA